MFGTQKKKRYSHVHIEKLKEIAEKKLAKNKSNEIIEIQEINFNRENYLLNKNKPVFIRCADCNIPCKEFKGLKKHKEQSICGGKKLFNKIL